MNVKRYRDGTAIDRRTLNIEEFIAYSAILAIIAAVLMAGVILDRVW